MFAMQMSVYKRHGHRNAYIWKKCIACFKSIVIEVWFVCVLLNYVHIDIQPLLVHLEVQDPECNRNMQIFALPITAVW